MGEAIIDFKQIIMERDGTTPCFARLLGIVGAVNVMGLAAFAIWKGQTIDLMQFALAWSALTVGTAGAARMKLETEGDAK